MCNANLATAFQFRVGPAMASGAALLEPGALIGKMLTEKKVG